MTERNVTLIRFLIKYILKIYYHQKTNSGQIMSKWRVSGSSKWPLLGFSFNYARSSFQKTERGEHINKGIVFIIYETNLPIYRSSLLL